ncbi:MAG: DUF1828 domain-containing protein [Actinobacteria bacterium]|nr:MAG: DUF1828 domain-containing protein [Actinomycetota bacterium]
MSDPTPDELRRQLESVLCDNVFVDERPDGSFELATPFLFPDGDVLPVVIERTLSGWSLTDRGRASAHLFFDDDSVPTDAQQRTLERIARARGVTYVDGALKAEFDQLPDAFKIADFVQVVAQVGVIPHLGADRSYEKYTTRVRNRVEEWIPEERRVRSWSPDQDTRRVYSADLKIDADGNGSVVVMFFLGSHGKPDMAATAVHRYVNWDLNFRTLAPWNPDSNIGDDELARFDDAVEGHGRRIKTPAKDITELRYALDAAGVPMVNK